MQLQIAAEFDPQTETPVIAQAFRDRDAVFPGGPEAGHESTVERLYNRFARPTAPHDQEALEDAYDTLEALRRYALDGAARAGELGRLELVEGCADRGMALGLDEAGLRAEFVRSRREHADLIARAQSLLSTPLRAAEVAIRDAATHPFLYERAAWRVPCYGANGGLTNRPGAGLT
jgi:hypothetical protein